MLDKFSQHEKLVLHILGKRHMTIQEISEQFYHSQELPLESRNYVAQILRRIVRKCEKEKLDWTIQGTGGGRGGRTVWKARRH